MQHTPGSGSGRTWTQAASSIIGLLLIVLAISRITSQQLSIASDIGEGLSPRDSSSEANVIRASEFYFDHGFLKNALLPNFGYGDRFVRKGVRPGMPGRNLDPLIYTHSPPGSELLTGLATRIFGKGEIAKYRLFPITLCALSYLGFGLLIAFSYGWISAALLVGTFSCIPLFSNMMHCLYYQGYALALLTLQLGLISYYFERHLSKNSPSKQEWFFGAAFFLFGLFQGFLSFDFFFVVSFAALPFCIVANKPSHGRALFISLACPFLGFVAAHFLHLIQNAIYFSNFSFAIFDLLDAAEYRSLGRGDGVDPGRISTLSLLLQYVRVIVDRKIFFGFDLEYYFGFLVLLHSFAQLQVTPIKPFSFTVSWRTSLRTAQACIIAFALSSLWIVIMKNHAMTHRHYIPRLYFYFFAVTALIVLSQIKVHKAEQEKPTT